MPRILLVDDEPEVGRSLSEMFGAPQYEFTQVNRGEEAQAAVSSFAPDVVLLDIHLPECNGIDILKDLRTQAPDLPIIIISGDITTDNAIEAMKGGAFEFVTKPFRLPQLLDAVKKATEPQLHGVVSTVMDEGKDADVRRIVGTSPEIVEIAKLIGQVAATDASVLILGESGTGKELVARSVHDNSHRSTKPFLSVNCAALPDTLLESELFGYEKGAFTGAYTRRPGKFEQAEGGTLFLDEVADMSLVTQSKVLRVLQEKAFERLGGDKSIQANVRVIAATNKSLVHKMKEGLFRVDLFYRLKVVSMYLPPLRERRGDIPVLTEHFISKYSRQTGRRLAGVTQEAAQFLNTYPWPGNIRELENNIHNAVVMSKGDYLKPEDFPIYAESGRASQIDYSVIQEDYVKLFQQLIDPIFDRIIQTSGQQIYAHLQAALEKTMISAALKANRSNQVKTAEMLGISRNTLRDRMAKYELV
jgi:two-component system, NtrC family, nitrogen regulation response regulator GlnG